MPKFTEDISKIKSAMNNAVKINLPDLSSFNTNYDFRKMTEFKNPMVAKLEKQNELQQESSDYLRSLVDLNIKISDYNKELVSLNEKILNKINSLDDTLLFLNDALINKSEIDKDQGNAHNALLLELITIIDSKDEGKLKQFANGIAAPVLAGIIVEYFKIKLGLSK